MQRRSFVSTLLSTGIGLLVSLFVRTQVAAMMLTVIVTIVPSVLYSGLLVPIASMDAAGQFEAHLFPAMYYTDIVLGSFLKGVGLEQLWGKVLALRAPEVCARYLSNGQREGCYWTVGDVANNPGRSLYVRLAGPDYGRGAAGHWADRYGRVRIASASLMVSGACCVAAGLFFGAPVWLLYLLAIVWGFSVVSDSAQFSALVTEHSPRAHVGTALTLQTCLGFLLTTISMRWLPSIAETYGWQWAFLLLVPGPIAGLAAMRALARPRPPSAE